MQKLIILPLLFLATFLHSQANDDLAGDWVNDEKTLFVNIHQNSIRTIFVGSYPDLLLLGAGEFSGQYYVNVDTFATLEEGAGDIQILRKCQLSLEKNSLLMKFVEPEIEFLLKRFDEDNENVIQKIQISTSGCYGTCSIYDIEINRDGRIYYNGIKFTEKSGYFYTGISEEAWHLLIANLNILEIELYFEKFSQESPKVDDSQEYFLKIYKERKLANLNFVNEYLPFQIEELIKTIEKTMETEVFQKMNQAHTFESRLDLQAVLKNQ